VHKPNRNTFDLVIVVDDIDAIKVWSEQIECALGGLKPQYHVALSGISHLDRNRKRFTSTKKLMFLLDTKHQTFDSLIMKQWIEHFRRRRPKEVMCVLVDSKNDGTVSYIPNVIRGNCYVVKTDNIGNFQNWWPRMIRFLFLSVNCSSKALTYTLESENMHKEDTLEIKLVQCLNSFVRPQDTRTRIHCQTVKLIGGNGDRQRQEEEALHVVLATYRLQRGEFASCDSVHTRAEVLRCVLFILIDAAIVPVRRSTKTEPPRLLMCLLSICVFILNLPTALLVYSYLFSPLLGFIPTMYFVMDKIDLRFILAFDVCALLPFVIVGSLSLTEHIVLSLTKAWITVLFFLLPFIYIIGWATIGHIYCYKKLNCQTGIWSLPGNLWRFEPQPHSLLQIIHLIILCFSFPVLLVQGLLCGVYGIMNIISIAVCFNIFKEASNLLKSDADFLYKIFLDKHILAVVPIPGALMMLLAYPWYYALMVCFATSIYFMLAILFKF